jgi:hypothetical protein
MLQEVFDLLLLRRLEPQWVGGELHVQIRGRAYALANYPGGVAIREADMKTPDESIFASVCEQPEEAISALGL